ncbi:unnamed protein product [Rhizoctonia solani]|uniref:Uncharacterized protein n=1 Tax=Rhizoctonia solani TaxID=456999 RepID=A0A8H3AVH0_9AGAM|nr:unnamed protein product [Rhizoctonia solani]
MIDTSKVYIIVCSKDNLALFIPPGADRAPMPLQCMPPSVPGSPVRFVSLGGDKYKVIPLHFPDRVIAAYHNSPEKELLLASQEEEGSCYTEWGIDPNGDDKFEIHTLSGPGDEYWTSEGSGVGIRLEGSQGKEEQQWKLVAMDD